MCDETLTMLCCWKKQERYKKCGSCDDKSWHSNCKRICVLKQGSGKVIFANDYGKIDQPWQISPTELPQNIESPPF